MKISSISNKEIPKGEEVKGQDVREGVFDFIQLNFPEFDKDSYITLPELNHYRRQYLTSLILQEKGELAAIDKDVMEAIKNNSILSENIQDEIEGDLSFEQKIADQVAAFGGSWTFIIMFFAFIVIWMLINIWFLATKPFDPYPFILLNLLLSCLAAIQAPIIMMSQNRQEQKDRQRGEHDYKINLKAELEIKLLSEKIDHLLVHQSKKLLEIQEVQIDYLEDLMKEIRKK
ncbi:MAG: DUF1003 domain-containing protein [Chitinophagales bacterium]|jgi:uncharacterized membrane protein|nr:DUF1003 domain-containing protein [Chitinophagales bacterium]MCC7056189.1 DUF1003 domain-containing protein [Chitinophagales bacterium]MDA0199362.1 DUF1003 domain-containing protein [Bacteroidota bacterium]HMS50985.1 DUF1003 domain-containing protein [Chitinophagales bacterium]